NGVKHILRLFAGITFLVARAVEGLDPANVTLVDVNGNILSGGRGDSAEQITSSQLEFQLAFERNLERRVQTMLEKVTGPQNVIVRVASELDFRRVETEEAFDPDGVVVRSEQRGKETSAAGSGRSASANAGGGGSGKESQATRENETTNFEISKTVRHVQEAVGKPKKISVAVLLGTPKRAGGDSKAAPPEINEDTLAQIQTLVKTAIGFNADRGDQVEVVKLSYDLATTATVSDLEPVESGGLGSGLMPLLIRYGSIALMGVLVLLFFVRPLMRFATGGATRDREMIRLPKTVDELETELEGEPEGSAAEGTPALPKGPSRKERLHQLAKDDPERLVSIARTWLQDEG
ncbi:MAG: flagellar basal-body MS-ring/collar protein FliF, partial [Nitrospinota bacterium]